MGAECRLAVQNAGIIPSGRCVDQNGRGIENLSMALTVDAVINNDPEVTEHALFSVGRMSVV